MTISLHFFLIILHIISSSDYTALTFFKMDSFAYMFLKFFSYYSYQVFIDFGFPDIFLSREVC